MGQYLWESDDKIGHTCYSNTHNRLTLCLCESVPLLMLLPDVVSGD